MSLKLNYQLMKNDEVSSTLDRMADEILKTNNGRHDVLYTGRTIRAALDALCDFGRMRTIQLAVMIDRGHRELPIEANFIGKKITTKDSEVVEVRLKEIDGEDAIYVMEKI